MRLWSLHPRMLDQKGLVACWREALLAKAVLECKTKGYKNHPQLNRFKNSENPLISINLYLKFVYIEAKNRGYKFDKTKFIEYPNCEMIRVTRGQVDFEYRHLLAKFESRGIDYHNKIFNKCFGVNPIFIIVDGSVESWEKV